MLKGESSVISICFIIRKLNGSFISILITFQIYLFACLETVRDYKTSFLNLKQRSKYQRGFFTFEKDNIQVLEYTSFELI